MNPTGKREDPYGMTAPCDNCPFLRQGGVRLRRGRIEEIAGQMLARSGGEFPCHKTTEECEDEDGTSRRSGPMTKHCAGALVFAVKNDNETQMMRIAWRLSLFDPARLRGHDLVFDTLEEMLESADDGPSARARLAQEKIRERSAAASRTRATPPHRR